MNINIRKNIILLRSIICVILLSVSIFGYAQSDDDDGYLIHVEDFEAPIISPDATIEVETVEVVDFRKPSKKKLEKLQSDSRFDYEETKSQDSSPSVPVSIFGAILKVLITIFSNTVVIWIVIILVVTFLVYLILRFLDIDVRSAFKREKVTNEEEMDINPELTHAKSFEELIEEALAQKDFRLAVRYLYLKNLRLLSDMSLIDWKVNKTNYNYLSEIENPDLRKEFLNTTVIFDYVWYGEFPVDESNYSFVAEKMSVLPKMMKR